MSRLLNVSGTAGRFGVPPKGEPLSAEQLAKILATRQRNHGPFLTPEVLRERKRAGDRDYYRRNQERIKTRSAEWYLENLERARARGRHYAKQHAAEARERYERWLVDPTNRAKTYVKNAQYRAANPGKRQMWQVARRARKAGAFVEDVDRRIVLERGNGLCGICGNPVDPARFDVDHIIPLVMGGEHSYANTQPAHPSCNYRKPKRLAP